MVFEFDKIINVINKISRLKIKDGFSLIELLISISILAIIGSILLAHFREGERKNRLNLSSEVLISNVRKIQNMVLNGSDCASGEMPYGGYGFYFDSNRYFIFADDNGNMLYDEGEEFDEINFSDFTIAVSDEDGNSLKNLIFLPPKAQICLNVNGCAPCNCNLKNNGAYSIIFTDSKGDAAGISINQISGAAGRE